MKIFLRGGGLFFCNTQITNTSLLLVGFFSAIPCLIGCHDSSPSGFSGRIEPFEPYIKNRQLIEFSSITDCPDGWTDEFLDLGHDFRPSYCEPPLLPSPTSPSPPDPQSPLAPEAPRFLPCPPGWNKWVDERVVMVNGPNGSKSPVKRTDVSCRPFPENRPMDCGSGVIDEAHFPGEPECRHIGTGCPQGRGLWAPSLPDDGRKVVYVEAGASEGSGTRDEPYGTIGNAIAREGSNVVIALSKGIFNESIQLNEGIVLWGACVAETILSGSITNSQEAVITSSAQNTEARNLQITGEHLGVSISDPTSSFHLEDVVISGCSDNGIGIDSGNASLKNVVVQNIQNGPALDVKNGGNVEVSQSVFRNNFGTGIQAQHEGTTLILEDVSVQDTTGNGLFVSEKANAIIKRSIFLQSLDLGVHVTDDGTTAVLEDIFIHESGEGTYHKCGLSVGNGANVEAKRIVVSKSYSFGVVVGIAHAVLKLEDILVKDTQPFFNPKRGEQLLGMGVYFAQGAQLEITRAILQSNHAAGVISAGSPPASVMLQDVVVRDTLPSYSRSGSEVRSVGGRGASFYGVAIAHFKRVVFENNKQAGILVEKNSFLKLEDGVIRDTQAQDYGDKFGRGLVVENHSHAEVFRSVFQNNRDISIFGSLNSNVYLHDVVVQDTLGNRGDGSAGRGLEVQSGSKASVINSVFRKNRDIGLFAVNEATKLYIENVFISQTMQKQCALGPAQSCPGAGNGIGVVSHDGAFIHLRRFASFENALCGAQLAFGDSTQPGLLKMEHGIVARNDVCGLNMQAAPDSGISDMTETVLFYENNYNNLDSSQLFLPSISETVSGL